MHTASIDSLYVPQTELYVQVSVHASARTDAIFKNYEKCSQCFFIHLVHYARTDAIFKNYEKCSQCFFIHLVHYARTDAIPNIMKNSFIFLHFKYA